MNIQGWSPLGLTGLISLLSKVLSRVFSSTTARKHQFFGTQPTLRSNSHIHRWLTGKTIVSTIWAFVAKVMSLLFNTLSRFIVAFLPRNKCLNFMATVRSGFGAQENKICHCFHFFPFYLPWSGCYGLSFFNVEIQASFSLSFHPHQEAL